MAAMNSAMEAGGAVMVESVNMNLPFGCGMPMSGYWWRWWCMRYCSVRESYATMFPLLAAAPALGGECI